MLQAGSQTLTTLCRGWASRDASHIALGAKNEALLTADARPLTWWECSCSAALLNPLEQIRPILMPTWELRIKGNKGLVVIQDKAIGLVLTASD